MPAQSAQIARLDRGTGCGAGAPALLALEPRLTGDNGDCLITHMSPTAPPTVARSSADTRRTAVVRSALTLFARSGYWATPVADVAVAAGISPAYVFRLFDSKLGLFTAALDLCFTRIAEALDGAADAAAEQARATGSDLPPEVVLGQLGDAYASLIADRDLLMLQVHALSAVDVPEIAEAVRRGCERVVLLVQDRTGAPPAAVQQFIAYGQLCHLIVAAGLEPVQAPWAKVLTDGMAHPTVHPTAQFGAHPQPVVA